MEEKIFTNAEYGEGFKELMGKQPVWVVRWGLTVIVFSVVVFVTLGYFLEYPDTISARATITSSNPPALVVSKVKGVIGDIFIDNHKPVKKGEAVAIIENTTNYDHYLWVKERLRNKSFLSFDSFEGKQLELGSLQDFYNNYLLQLRKQDIRVDLKKYALELENKKRVVKERKIRLTHEIKKQEIFEERMKLLEADVKRSKRLFDNGVLSSMEYDTKQQAYLLEKQSFEDLKIAISNTKNDITTLESDIKLLSVNNQLDIAMESEAAVAAKRILIERMDAWERDYLLLSPISGVVDFHNKVIKENTNLELGEEVFTIIPDKNGEVVAHVYAPITNSGKIELGQKVNIFLANFPYSEYGLVCGKVNNISTVPSNMDYLIEVSLPTGLTTTYKKTIDFKPNMQGTASIITEELNIIERVFHGLRAILIKT